MPSRTAAAAENREKKEPQPRFLFLYMSLSPPSEKGGGPILYMYAYLEMAGSESIISGYIEIVGMYIQ